MTSRFRILKQGYDRFEVDRILDQYESQLKHLQEKLDSYQNQLKAAEKQIDLMKQRYDMLQNEVLTKEKAAQQVHSLALKESNTIIETANKNADLIVSEALSTARMMLMEVSKMSEQTNQVKMDLKKQLSGLSMLLDDIELPDIPHLDWLQENKKQSGEE